MSPRFFPTSLAFLALLPSIAGAQITTRMSVDIAGNQAAGFSAYIGVSRDAKFVVFSSDAANLVPGDTNGVLDVFGKDVATGVISRLSVGPGGVQGNAGSGGTPGISADGGIVSFESAASNLVAGDTNGTGDIFVRNTKTGTTIRASVGSGGVEANDYSTHTAVSGNGRYVTFCSYASNLVPGDTNGVPDIFVRDLQTNQTTRVSVATGGGQANGGSLYSSISGDGRYVVFDSDASNLVPGDTNGLRDVFVRDTVAGTTTRISVATGGAQGNGASSLDSNAVISDDGHWIVFETWASNFDPSDTNGVSDIYLHDLQTGGTYFDSGYTHTIPNGPCFRPVISADGMVVAWETTATNLTYPPDGNGAYDIIVFDPNGGLTRASVGLGGVDSNSDSLIAALSGDGRFVGFESEASNLVAGDTNGSRDVFLRDLHPLPGTCNERQSVSVAGVQGNAASTAGYVSGDGRWIAFESEAETLLPGGADTNGVADVFERDRESHALIRCSVSSGGAEANGPSHAPSVSNDGRWVAFASSASNLVPNDFNGDDVFVHDRLTGATVRVSVDSSGLEANGGSYVPPFGGPSISPDGRYVAFVSSASNLVANDTNGFDDVFVHDRDFDGNGIFDEQGTGKIRTVLVSKATTGFSGNGPSGDYGLWISAYGRRVAFQSFATDLVANDLGFSDIFVRNLQNNTTTLVSVDSNEVQQPGFHELPSISADLTLANDGRFVTFASDSGTLVPNDTNGQVDIFLRDLATTTTTRVNVSTGGAQSDGQSQRSMVDGSGRYVVFDSNATTLDPADVDSTFDVFLRDRQLGTTEVVSLPTNAGEGMRPTVSVGATAIAWEDNGSLVLQDTNGATDVYVHACAPDTPMVAFCFPGVGGTRTCPCGNPPTGSGGGCNKFGVGPADSAKLSAAGTASLSADTVVFTSAGENNTATTVLIQAKTAVFGGVAFGAGVRCASGTLKRLYTGAATGGTFTRPSGADPTSVSARSTAQGDTILAGEHRYYFGYYRDPSAAGPCGSAASTFNCTQAGDVQWAP